MKRLILTGLLMASSNLLFAQSEKNNIHACITGFFNALSIFNVDSLKYYSTPDFHLLEDGLVWNMDTLINKISGRTSKVERINKFAFIKTAQQGNMAWVSYNNTALFRRAEKEQTIKWLESAVLMKNKGKWKIQLLHSTRLK